MDDHTIDDFLIHVLEIPPPSSIVNSQGVDIYHSKSEKLRNGHQQNSYKKHEEKGKKIL